MHIEKEKRYSAHNYDSLPLVLTEGKGVWLYDESGKKYLDMMSAYSAVNYGHSHPRLIKALTQQAERLAIPSRAFYNNQLGTFLEKLCDLAGFEMAVPMNTGAEAVETALKAARRWGYRVKGIPANKAEIIVMKNNFHGRTISIISFSSDAQYRSDFGPFTPGFVEVPFGNAAALEKAITPNTCAILLEPIQGEAGIYVPPAGYLKEVERLARAHNVLLILDEIQSGFGRTGKLFAFHHEDIQPDGLIVGKALGGGLYPVSAFLANKEILELFEPGSHGSTFGGNALACAVAHEGLLLLEEEKLVERAEILGAYLFELLGKLKSPLIKDIRGKGLWAGVEFDPVQVEAREIAEKLMHKGVLTKETHETVIRLAPPLVITREEIKWGVQQLADVLREISPKKIAV